MYSTVVMMCAVSLVASSHVPPHSSSTICRYWCKTPEGQAYCCEGNNKPIGPLAVKPGFCPPVRAVCPPTRSFGPPVTCSNDGSCIGEEKCCFDRCLEEHVCKAPLPHPVKPYPTPYHE